MTNEQKQAIRLKALEEMVKSCAWSIAYDVAFTLRMHNKAKREWPSQASEHKRLYLAAVSASRFFRRKAVEFNLWDEIQPELKNIITEYRKSYNI